MQLGAITSVARNTKLLRRISSNQRSLTKGMSSIQYSGVCNNIPSRFIHAWIALGHCLSAQEESEHAISAFRTALRISPGDHKPLVFMAIELVKINNFTMGLHLLVNALKMDADDPVIMNEIGVILIQLKRSLLVVMIIILLSFLSYLILQNRRIADIFRHCCEYHDFKLAER